MLDRTAGACELLVAIQLLDWVGMLNSMRARQIRLLVQVA